MSRLHLFAAVLSGAIAACGVATAQSCDVAAEKRVLIGAVLCGQNASASDYRVNGIGCIEKAFKARLLDTAKQVAVLRACGDAEFANRLRSGTLQSMKFVQALSFCSDERVDFANFYMSAEREVAGRSAMLVCTSELTNAINAQRASLERGLAVALDPASARAIEDRFSIKVDEAGNVVERSAR